MEKDLKKKYTCACLCVYVCVCVCMASLMTQIVQNPPATQETWVLSLSWEDPLETVMATVLQCSC